MADFKNEPIQLKDMVYFLFRLKKDHPFVSLFPGRTAGSLPKEIVRNRSMHGGRNRGEQMMCNHECIRIDEFVAQIVNRGYCPISVFCWQDRDPDRMVIKVVYCLEGSTDPRLTLEQTKALVELIGSTWTWLAGMEYRHSISFQLTNHLQDPRCRRKLALVDGMIESLEVAPERIQEHVSITNGVPQLT